MIIFFIVWYLIGFISMNVGELIYDNKITLSGLLLAIFMGLFGLITFVMILDVLYGSEFKDITLFERKKK